MLSSVVPTSKGKTVESLIVMLGRFSEEALSRVSRALSGGTEEFSESVFDFRRCKRKDGSVYGTSGQCRKGSETGEEEDVDKMLNRLDKETGIFKKKTNKQKETAEEMKLTKQTVDWVNDIWMSKGQKGPVEVLDLAGNPPSRKNSWLFDLVNNEHEGKLVTKDGKEYHFRVTNEPGNSQFITKPL
jgi:hypothetical protein